MKLYRRLLRYLLPYWKRFTAALFFMVVVALTTAGAALLVRNVLDDIFIEKDAAMLWILPGLIVGLYVVKGVAYFLQSYNMKRIGQLVVRNIRDDLFSHLQELSLSFFYHHPTGSLISRFVNDALLLQEAVTIALASVLRDTITIAALVGVIYYRDPGLATIAVLVLPLAIYPMTRFGRTSRKVGKKSQAQVGSISSILHENITGAKIVKAFGMEEAERRRFREENHRLFTLYLRLKKVEALSPAIMEFLGSLGVAGVVLFGGHKVINGGLTPGTFFSFMTALLLLYEPVKRLVSVNNRIQEALAASDRIFSILDAEVDVKDSPEAAALPPIKESIEFRDVSFGYDQRLTLKNINLTVHSGEMLAIVGASGAGKSTLVNLIPRFFDPLEGSVYIDGKNIRDVTVASLRSSIGLVTQESILFNDTVRNNISFGRPGAGDDEIEGAAKAAFAHEFISAMPLGYETVVGERGSALSGGERQRLCIARAILKNAPVLILDEATSALDTESARIVQEALNNLMRGKTTFLIAHSFTTVLNAPRIIVMERGTIVADGSHSELMDDSSLYHRLFELQFQDPSEGNPP